MTGDKTYYNFVYYTTRSSIFIIVVIDVNYFEYCKLQVYRIL